MRQRGGRTGAVLLVTVLAAGLATVLAGPAPAGADGGAEASCPGGRPVIVVHDLARDARDGDVLAARLRGLGCQVVVPTYGRPEGPGGLLTRGGERP